jgi:hypothetical protein
LPLAVRQEEALAAQIRIVAAIIAMLGSEALMRAQSNAQGLIVAWPRRHAASVLRLDPPRRPALADQLWASAHVIE